MAEARERMLGGGKQGKGREGRRGYERQEKGKERDGKGAKARGR